MTRLTSTTIGTSSSMKHQHHHQHQQQNHLHHDHHDHQNHITPQHEVNHSFDRKSSPIVFRLSSRRPPKRHDPSLPIKQRDISEPRTVDKADELPSRPASHDDDHPDNLSFDLDRMSEHEPSSGDGDEEPPSPDLVTSYKPEPSHQSKEPQWRSSSAGLRPPYPPQHQHHHHQQQRQRQHQQQPVPRNSRSSTGNGPSNRAMPPHIKDERQVVGSAQTLLPAEKVFPVQVGSEVFRLSGASISSDAPSYITHFFEEQIRQNEETGGVQALIIDRDPETFRDIARHLQGYHVKPKDGPHFVRLFADAQYYSLPRLISQLFESEIYIQIGEQHFQIPKDIFSEPGNSPNFFSLGFAVFFSTPQDVFPGLDRRGLLRPPPINPPCVPNRSATIFSDLLHLLRGYPLEIRNETHRTELLRDCRYFHLRGLEQRIIAHDISYNLERQKTEICIRLGDLRPSGITYKADEVTESLGEPAESGWIQYARPFVDESSYEMIVEIGEESTILDLDEMRLDFRGKTKARVSSLFQVIANKMNLPSNQPLGLIMLSGGTAKRSPSPGHSPLSEDKVRVRFDAVADVMLDNSALNLDWSSELGRHMQTGSNKRVDHEEEVEDESSMTDDSSSVSQSSSSVQQRPHQVAVGSSKNQKDRAYPPLNRPLTTEPLPKKRKMEAASSRFGRWTIKTGQWRLRVEPSTNTARGKYEIVFIAVKIDAFRNERARNIRRSFLV